MTRTVPWARQTARPSFATSMRTTAVRFVSETIWARAPLSRWGPFPGFTSLRLAEFEAALEEAQDLALTRKVDGPG